MTHVLAELVAAAAVPAGTQDEQLAVAFGQRVLRQHVGGEHQPALQHVGVVGEGAEDVERRAIGPVQTLGEQLGEARVVGGSAGLQSGLRFCHEPTVPARPAPDGQQACTAGHGKRHGHRAHVLPDLRTELRAGRPGRRRPAGEAHARPRPSGDEGVRLPQGARRGRPAPRPRPARPPDAARAADGTLGRPRRGTTRSPPPPAGCRPSSTTHGIDSVAAYVGNPTAFNALGQLHTGTLLRTLGVRAHVLLGHAGLRQQVRRQRGRVRVAARCTRSPTSPTPTCASSSARTRGRRRRASTRCPTCSARCAAPPPAVRASCSSTRAASRRPRWASATRCSSGPTPTCGSSPRCCTRSIGSAGSTSTSSPPRAHVDELRGIHRPVPGRAHGRRHRHRRRRRARAGGGLGGHAACLGARQHRHQHGPPGHARLLARAHAVVRHRPARCRGRQPEERRLLPQRPLRRGQPRAGLRRHRVRAAAPRQPARHAAVAEHPRQRPPVRALIVVAGNPLLSIAGEDRLRKAFEQLELLVVIDIYPSATSEYAHVLLPATDMYERDDLNIVNIGTSAQPFAQYTPAVVAPKADRKPEWWIAHRCCRRWGSRRCSTTSPTGAARPVGEVAAHARSAAAACSWPTCTTAWPACCRCPRPARSSTTRCTRPTVASTAARPCSPTPSSAAAVCSTRRRPHAHRRRAAAHPQARPVDAQLVVREPRADEAERPHQQPVGHRPVRRRSDSACRRRPRSRWPVRTARSMPWSRSTTT